MFDHVFLLFSISSKNNKYLDKNFNICLIFCKVKIEFEYRENFIHFLLQFRQKMQDEIFICEYFL
jgi:hypothetical protein